MMNILNALITCTHIRTGLEADGDVEENLGIRHHASRNKAR